MENKEDKESTEKPEEEDDDDGPPPGWQQPILPPPAPASAAPQPPPSSSGQKPSLFTTSFICFSEYLNWFICIILILFKTLITSFFIIQKPLAPKHSIHLSFILQ